MSRRSPRVAVQEVTRPPSEEQFDTWRAALGPFLKDPDEVAKELAAEFDMSDCSISSVIDQVSDDLDAGKEPLETLTDACRKAIPRMEGLAERLDTRASWDDLALSEDQLMVLENVVVHVRKLNTVYDTRDRLGRPKGAGIRALFAGPSGTGKTLAARILARELGMDLYRVDLAAIINKYIGETEKNLHQVLSRADELCTILLLDEGDALLGERTDARDGHDRYANMEASFLLQRLEEYRGLSILATNDEQADPEFEKGFRFIVHFTKPDE